MDRLLKTTPGTRMNTLLLEFQSKINVGVVSYKIGLKYYKICATEGTMFLKDLVYSF
jgi:hypothetical protein